MPQYRPTTNVRMNGKRYLAGVVVELTPEEAAMSRHFVKVEAPKKAEPAKQAPKSVEPAEKKDSK